MQVQPVEGAMGCGQGRKLDNALMGGGGHCVL
jgi:hypothetical protein